MSQHKKEDQKNIFPAWAIVLIVIGGLLFITAVGGFLVWKRANMDSTPKHFEIVMEYFDPDDNDSSEFLANFVNISDDSNSNENVTVPKVNKMEVLQKLDADTRDLYLSDW